MRNRELALLLLVLGGCSSDESGTGDGGVDATSDVVTDAGVDAAKDAAPDVGSDVTFIPLCDGGKTCGNPNDCPAPPACVTRTCANSCCGTAVAAVGVPCNADGGHVCDGTGQCVACNSGNDCAQTTTLCQVPGCTNNTCVTTNAATGTPCNDDGGKFCDGTGVCVVCNQPSDCPVQTTVCKTNACTQNTCAVTFTATGTACKDNGGHVCDGTGNCVQCNTSTDCLAINDSGTLSCVNSQCQ